jgi:ribonuclease D
VNYQIVDTKEALEAVCLAARDADTVMLDTEFVRTRTFYPQLGLIQLFDGNVLSLIDSTVISDMTLFVDLLKDTSVLKVLHACVFRLRFVDWVRGIGERVLRCRAG